jgi:hypothetical protein
MVAAATVFDCSGDARDVTENADERSKAQSAPSLRMRLKNGSPFGGPFGLPGRRSSI